MSMTAIEHKRIKFSDLVFLEDNPRRINEREFDRLAESIRKDPAFFDNRPCLVNFTDGKFLVYAGFQRAHAAHRLLGWAEIPCNIENDVPTAVMRERAIRDNTHQGAWDSDVLSSWEFETEELEDMGVPSYVWGGIGDSDETDATDYSWKNKELDGDSFLDEMEIKFKFSKDDFMDIQERLNVVCAKQNVETKEDALRELLMFYERHGS